MRLEDEAKRVRGRVVKREGVVKGREEERQLGRRELLIPNSFSGR